MDFSIVIPSYNRRQVLAEVLEALETQEGSSFEVVVVDDGSTDGTAEFLDELRTPLAVQILHQENAGPAAARNAGVALARGRWVAFLGDDTVPRTGWLQGHREALGSAAAEEIRAQGGEVGVIGYTSWHPRMRMTPFLRYINEFGLQFGYSLLDDPLDVGFQFFYTSNLSLPRELLLENPFNTSFPYAAWEDIEVSYRLYAKGFRLHYAAEAQVAHDHPTDLLRFAERQERAGYCAAVFYRLHPELGGFLGFGEGGPPALPGAARQRWRMRLARGLQKLPVSLPRLWEDVLRYHYIVGLHRGWQATQP
ncbi:MAG: glycosyltransferase family 2 protein [Acidobacteriota bacterium]